jgi:hypothetical protein
MDIDQSRQFAEDSDRILCAIGRVVVAFQLLELWVAEALGLALGMKAKDDRHLVSAAMSYRQKVDLLFELYARHGAPNPKVSLDVTKRAMLVAEEFRHRVVHSVWAVRGEDSKRWVRTKANLRGKTGFDVNTKPVQVALLEQASRSMNDIRAWEEGNESELLRAIKTLSTLKADA